MPCATRITGTTVFLRSDAVGTIYFTARLCGYYLRAVFVYFFGNINDGWIRYVRVRWWQLLDAVSSTHSLSVLLSAVRTTCTTQTVLALAWWSSSEIICTCVHMPSVLAAATIWGRHLFYSRASDCAATISDYSTVATIRGWRLFEGGDYSRAATIRRNVVSAHGSGKLAVAWESNSGFLAWARAYDDEEDVCTTVKTGGTSCVPNEMT